MDMVDRAIQMAENRRQMTDQAGSTRFGSGGYGVGWCRQEAVALDQLQPLTEQATADLQARGFVLKENKVVRGKLQHSKEHYLHLSHPEGHFASISAVQCSPGPHLFCVSVYSAARP